MHARVAFNNAAHHLHALPGRTQDASMAIATAINSEFEDDLDNADASSVFSLLVDNMIMANFVEVFKVMRHLAQHASTASQQR